MQVLKSLAFLASAVIAMALPQPAPAGNNVFTSPAGGGNLQGLVNLAWTPGTPGTVSLYLVKGIEGNQKDEMEIAKALPNTGAYNWPIPITLQDSATITDGSKYAFRIKDDQTGAEQYSAPFSLTVPGSTFVPPAAPAPEAASPSAAATPSSSSASSSSSTPTPPSAVSSSTSSSASTPTPTPSSSSSASTSTPTPTSTPSSTAESTTTEPSSTDAPATTSTPITATPDSSSSPNVGLILGATFGSILGLGLLVVLILILLRKRRAAKTRAQMRSSGFQRGMEEVEREHAEYMQRVAAGEQNVAPPSRQPSTKQGGGFMGTAF